MDTQKIEDRIQALMIERSSLEQSHAGMIRGNQRMNEEFQQQVVKNQTRFAQITGAITELQQLVKPQKDTNNDNLSPTPNSHHRLADVCAVQQSENR